MSPAGGIRVIWTVATSFILVGADPGSHPETAASAASKDSVGAYATSIGPWRGQISRALHSAIAEPQNPIRHSGSRTTAAAVEPGCPIGPRRTRWTRR